MKKFFTLICALMAFGAIYAQEVCKHSYVLVADNWNNNGTEKIAKGASYGDGFFKTPTGQDKATNKGSVDLSDAEKWGESIAKKYGSYGSHLNSMRIKNAQDVFSINVTAGSKVMIFYNGQNKVGTAARWPKIATNAALTENVQNPAPTAEAGTVGIGVLEWTAPDDMVIYVGSYNGDTYISYVIIEANEPEGTPSVKVGAQAQDESGLWYRDVVCTPVQVYSEDEGDYLNTIVKYTTDGTTPDANSATYENAIRCYKGQTVKFQAYLDIMGDGSIADEDGQILQGAENEGIVSFSFDAPTISADGANVTITSPYNGAKNYVSYGDVTDKESSAETLSESATVTAYSVIENGSYATFTTKSTTTDVYVLNPIKEEKTIEVIAGKAVIDEEATATSTTGNVYTIEGGAISADKMDFFVKDLTFAALANADEAKAKYQVPSGQEAYIQMSNTNITFQVAEGDSVDVTVTLSKNSCKTIDGDSPVLQTYVNVNGKTYGYEDITNGDASNLDGYQNVITFGLTGGTYTFQKYSGTGNILISSINIKPVDTTTAISAVKNVNSVAKTVKGIENGKLVIKSAKGTFTAAGARIK